MSSSFTEYSSIFQHILMMKFINYYAGGKEMSDNEIEKSYERAAERMSGDKATFGSKLTNEHSNHPDTHQDIHNRIKIDYAGIHKSPSMEEVHKWQREHISKGDQSKEGYPMNVIIDPAMREMYQVVHNAGMTNVFDRFSQQQPIQCKFCIEGLSCQLCANGPCRISEKVPRGTCGVDAHTMVARNFVYRHVTIGTSANIFHCHQAARTLKAAGEHPDSGLKIRDAEKLKKYADMAGLDINKPNDKLAVDFADWVIADIHSPFH